MYSISLFLFLFLFLFFLLIIIHLFLTLIHIPFIPPSWNLRSNTKKGKRKKERKIKREWKYMGCLASVVYSMLHIRSTSTFTSTSRPHPVHIHLIIVVDIVLLFPPFFLLSLYVKLLIGWFILSYKLKININISREVSCVWCLHLRRYLLPLIWSSWSTT